VPAASVTDPDAKDAIVPSPLAARDPLSSRDELGAGRQPLVTSPRLVSRAMVPVIALAIGLTPAAAIAAQPEGVGTPSTPATTPGQPPAEGATDVRAPLIPALTKAKSPFRANRLASKPIALTPNQVTDPFEYPREPVAFTWAGVAGAVDYEVEIASNPGFSRIMYRTTTDQASLVPEVLLPDGTYWWRVVAIDKAGTRGLPSDAAQFVKTWPNRIGGLQTRADPLGPAVSSMRLNPFMRWDPLPGAKEYEVDLAPSDKFATPTFFARQMHTAFITAGAAGGLPDDIYRWRVRARDPADNPGQWVTSAPFTKASERTALVAPADNAAVDSIFLRWKPVTGAEKYQVQITQCANTFTGDDCLKINTETSSTGFAPTDKEREARNLTYGDFWWRVRHRVDGAFGGWSYPQKGRWDPQASTRPPAAMQIASTGDSDSALMPQLNWSHVAGARVYRVDIAADQNFNQILESVHTNQTGWVSRVPLPDNQTGTGYWWRVVPGSGVNGDSPAYLLYEEEVPSATVRKETRIVPAQSAEGLVQSEPTISWTQVPGAAKYELQLAKDAQFAGDTLRSATLYSTGGAPGGFKDDKTLPEGTWYWRVRAIDGGGTGQTWSPVKSFTLTRPRPEIAAPRDGETVVGSPTLRWSPEPQACAYQVQVRRDRNFEQQVAPEIAPPSADAGTAGSATPPGQPTAGDIQATYQTSWTPSGAIVDKPGTWYWRVRGDYCDGQYGQWTPLRSFKSIRPPDFNMNAVPSKLRYGYRLTVSGRLEQNGKPIKKARLAVERRFLKDPVHRVYGTVRTDARGRFAFSLPMRSSASWRVVWRDDATTERLLGPVVKPKPKPKAKPKPKKRAPAKAKKKPAKKTTAPKKKKETAVRVARSAPIVRRATARPVAPEEGIRGQAPFAVTVTPRVTLKLDKKRVVRNRKLKLTGSIFPRRPGQIQILGSDGWETIKKVKPRKSRFGVRVRAKLAPGRYRVRLYVPRDKRQRLGNGTSRRSGLFVYDRFVVRGGGR